MTPEELRIAQIFNPRAVRKRAEILEKKQRFVHYTTAQAAASIIRNKEVWMRNALCMNDYSEVQHGLDCLVDAYRENGRPLKDTLEGLFPGFCKEFEELFSSWMPALRHHTYITCVSEHQNDEDTVGRLSMWRAYGQTTGVAMVLYSAPFFADSDALNAYSRPIAYLSTDQFKREFRALVTGLAEGVELLRTLSREEVKNLLFNSFMFAGLCTKHPGYVEEKEYRVVHCPKLHPSTRLIKAVEIIGGAPQIVYKIPLQNIPDEGLTGVELPELLDRLIIGPTQHPLATYNAFVDLLNDAGVPNANEKVCVSDIPLRC